MQHRMIQCIWLGIQVNKLKEILFHEERMKHVLQQAMEQSFGGSSVPIPSFLPPKVNFFVFDHSMYIDIN